MIVAPLLPDDTDVEIDEGDLKIDTYRAQGAGGQHVNKTDSAVRITHLPTGIVVQCQNERSQSANKQTAMRVLKARLVERAEEEREAMMAKERGGSADTGFGGESIRSYVLHPYQLVKDTRTGYEIGKRPGGARRRPRPVHPRVPAGPGRREGSSSAVSYTFHTFAPGASVAARPRKPPCRNQISQPTPRRPLSSTAPLDTTRARAPAR